MKIKRIFAASLAALLVVSLSPADRLYAGTTIDINNRYAYAANLGWLDWVADTNNGAVIGEYVCAGYLYSANAGWINLGSGSPANGIQYQNNSALDFGVNQDGQGNLAGYAWAANIGWIAFEQTYGHPKVNLLTGALSGYIWSANCGWISLSNTVAYVQADTIARGAPAPDGLPIAWLLLNFGTTNINANGDPDHDGMSNLEEYLAGTDPNNSNSVLRITSESITAGGADVSLAWDSVPTRFYYLQKNLNLASPDWIDSGLGIIAPAGSSTTESLADTNAPARFYRVQAVRPLMP